jgi:hypothetical protein
MLKKTVMLKTVMLKTVMLSEGGAEAEASLPLRCDSN